MRTPVLLFVGAMLWIAPWAWAQAAPFDWDPSYYVGVARHIAAGHGAVTDAVWNLGHLPGALTHAADLHWMPLVSRWLAPFVWLPGDDWRAAQLATALLGAAWAPLGWWWARRLGAEGAVAVCAGIAAGTGGAWLRWLTSPETIALHGLLASACWLAPSPRRSAILAVASALTRGEGALVGLVGVLRGRAGWAAAVTGVAAAAAWAWRADRIAGAGATGLRARTLNATEAGQWLTVTPPPTLDLAGRVEFLVAHLDVWGRAMVLGTGFLLAPFAILGLWRHRRVLAAPLAYLLLVPPFLLLAAPAVAAEGSVFRTLAATWPPLCAAAVVGAAGLTRRYHPAFVPGLLVGALAAVSLSAAARSRDFRPPFDDCAALAGLPAGTPILSYDPLGTATRCGHPGIILARGDSTADLHALAVTYDIHHVLPAPEAYHSWTLRPSELNQLLPPSMIVLSRPSEGSDPTH